MKKLLSLDAKRSLISIFLLIALGITKESFCMPVIYNFSGAVTKISDTTYTYLSLDDKYNGTLTYDYDLSQGIGYLGSGGGGLLGVSANFSVDFGGGRTMWSSDFQPILGGSYGETNSCFYFGTPSSNGLGGSKEDFTISLSNVTYDNSPTFLPYPEDFIITGLHFTTGYGGVTGCVAPVPEPATFVLIGVGLSGIAIWRKKRNIELT